MWVLRCVEAVRTDEEGRFEIERASALAEAAIVQVEESAPWSVIPIAPSQDRRSLVLQVGLLGRLRLDLADEVIAANAFWVLDAHGNRLQLGARMGGGLWVAGPQWDISRGARSEAVLVSEEAETLVLASGGSEIARFPIRILPGELNVVRP
jgi:hypothetical protein